MLIHRPDDVLVRSVGGVVTFADVVAELAPVYKSKSKKTRLEFETVTRLHLVPYFGPTDITKVGALWRHYCAHQRGLSPERRLWHDRKVLRLILGYAFDCDYVMKVPRLKLDAVDASRRVPGLIAPEDFERALRLSSPTLHDLLVVLYDTGMRFSEARTLKKEDVNFHTGQVRLASGSTKTRQERVYFLPERSRIVLLARIGGYSPFFFPNALNANKPISESHRSFERMRKRAEVDFNLHDIRHDFSTRMQRKGMPPALLGKLMGASERVLNTVYTHPSFQDWITFAGRADVN